MCTLCSVVTVLKLCICHVNPALKTVSSWELGSLSALAIVEAALQCS
jgi:hypothetical protein